MSDPTAPEGSDAASTRPYLIRALHDWCTDNGFTPYLAVHVDETVQVPREYVKNHEIVLNVSFDATSGLKLGNDFIEFRARFGGVPRELIVPVDHVIAIYARENGQGMAFPVPVAAAGAPAAVAPVELSGDEAGPAGAPRERRDTVSPLKLAPAPQAGRAPTAGDEDDAPVLASGDAGAADDEPPPPAPAGGRPTLKRVK